MTKNSKAGFSLVELMVVVAIIGVLATIAVPNYLKFQAKAKQANAKSELTGIFTAEKTFFTEYNSYHASLPYIGYVPEGITTSGTPACPSAIATGVIRYYESGFAAIAPAAAVGGTVFTCGSTTAGNYNNVYPASTAPGGTAVATPAVAATTFLARSRGKISNTANVDEWTINQDRALLNRAQGI
jgi:type IV pilus assembly protein PilA